MQAASPSPRCPRRSPLGQVPHPAPRPVPDTACPSPPVSAPRIQTLLPRSLADLAAVFDQLEDGQSVLLGSTVSPSTPLPESPGPWLGLLSSGTTGPSRTCWHRWPELCRTPVTIPRFRRWTWASPFRPDTYAGVQVALQAWATGGRCLALRGDWSGVWADLNCLRPEALCSTPTFLELLLATEPQPLSNNAWHPRHITLGGEPLRPGLGQRARQRFPEAGFTAIYAAAELGLLAKSHRPDGWYDSEALRECWDDWSTTEDGRLRVCRAGTWFATGDLVEVAPDRRAFRILGRADAIANVAGTKVRLEAVEAAAQEVPGIRSALAWAEPNPVTGQVVGLRFDVLPGVCPRQIQAALEEHLRRRLTKEAWPRRWEQGPPRLGPNAKRMP